MTQKRIEKDGESYLLKKCEDCGIEMKVANMGKKFCYECRAKHKKTIKYIRVDK
jgi:hypothetical protein